MTRRDFNVINHTEEILSRAIKEHSVEVYYQPIYDLHKKSFHSAEALARLKDPAYGMISPAIFMPSPLTCTLLSTSSQASSHPKFSTWSVYSR